MADEVGKIGLGIEFVGDIGKQINTFAKQLGEKMGKAFGATLKGVDFSDAMKDAVNGTGDLNNALKVTLQGVNDVTEAMKGTTAEIKEAEKAVDSLAAKMSKVPASVVQPSMPMNVVKPSAPRAPTVKPAIDTAAVSRELEQLTAVLDNVNAKIEIQQRKLQELKQSYENAFNDVKKNKLQEQIINTEATILRLTKQSDSASQKIWKLDDSLDSTGDAAEKAGSDIDRADKMLSRTNKTLNTTDQRLKATAKSANKMGNQFTQAFRRIAKQVLVFAVLYRAIRSFQQFMSSAIATNDEFSNSLSIIRTNLLVAFQPIWEVAAPALHYLIRMTARATQYLAAFLSGVMGRTYHESVRAAHGLHQARQAVQGYGKAVRDVHRSVSGFDELNVIGAPTGAGGIPGLDVPGVRIDFDLASADVAIESLEKINTLGSDIRKNFDGWRTSFSDFWEDSYFGGFHQWVLDLGDGRGVLEAAWDGVALLFTKPGQFWDNFKKSFSKMVRWAFGLDDISFTESLKKAGDNFFGAIGDFFGSHDTEPLFTRYVTNPIRKHLRELKEDTKSEFKAAWDWVVSIWDRSEKWFDDNVTKPLLVGFSRLRDGIQRRKEEAWESIKNTWNQARGWFKDRVTTPITEGFTSGWNNIKSRATDARDAVYNTWRNASSWIKNNVTDSISDHFLKLWPGVRVLSSNALRSVKDGWTKVSGWFRREVINPISNLFTGLWNTVIKGLNNVIGRLNRFRVDIPSWFPEFGGRSIGFNIPKIPLLARGGIVDQPTLAMVGEAGKEAVMPLENNTGWIDQLAEKVASGIQGSNDGTGDLTVILQMDTAQILKALISESERMNARAGKGVITLGVT